MGTPRHRRLGPAVLRPNPGAASHVLRHRVDIDPEDVLLGEYLAIRWDPELRAAEERREADRVLGERMRRINPACDPAISPVANVLSSGGAL